MIMSNLMKPIMKFDMDGTGYFDNAEMQNACGEIVKNLQAKEQALNLILESLDLHFSNFSVAVCRKTEDASETLMNQGISEVNKENIILSHIRKTLKNDEDWLIYTKLVLQKAEIENEQIVCRELSSSYNKAIKTYEKSIKKVSEELNDKVGSTLLSPENKARTKLNSGQRDLQQKICALCEKLYEKKTRANELNRKLSAFLGLPADVESANHEVYLKKRELEELDARIEDP